MNINSLSLTQRLRLTEALRQATTDEATPRVVSPEELVAIAPLLDECNIPLEQAAALVAGIVESFKDGSTVDPEAHKLLTATAAGFELGNMTREEKLLGNLLDLMKDGWSFRMSQGRSLGAQETIDKLTNRREGDEPVRVHAWFATGVSTTYDVDTTLGKQRQVVPRREEEFFNVTSLPELEALVSRGMKARPGKTEYEDIGQGLDERGRRERRP